MNLTAKPSLTELASLLRKEDDNAGHHSIWVGYDGQVHIDQFSSGFDIHNPAIKFRLETCTKGNQYVGPVAAGDEIWVKRVYSALTENWESGETGYVDVF